MRATAALQVRFISRIPVHFSSDEDGQSGRNTDRPLPHERGPPMRRAFRNAHQEPRLGGCAGSHAVTARGRSDRLSGTRDDSQGRLGKPGTHVRERSSYPRILRRLDIDSRPEPDIVQFEAPRALLRTAGWHATLGHLVVIRQKAPFAQQAALRRPATTCGRPLRRSWRGRPASRTRRHYGPNDSTGVHP